MELSSNKKTSLVLVGVFLIAGIILYAIVFTFWNFINEDNFEEVIILNNDDGVCYVETYDTIPKIITDCTLKPGDAATVKFVEGMPWATIVKP